MLQHNLYWFVIQRKISLLKERLQKMNDKKRLASTASLRHKMLEEGHIWMGTESIPPFLPCQIPKFTPKYSPKYCQPNNFVTNWYCWAILFLLSIFFCYHVFLFVLLYFCVNTTSPSYVHYRNFISFSMPIMETVHLPSPYPPRSLDPPPSVTDFATLLCPSQSLSLIQYIVLALISKLHATFAVFHHTLSSSFSQNSYPLP